MIIGLTGGIGSGKSTVLSFFKTLGVQTLDADKTSRALLTPPSEAFQKTVDHFGASILTEHGEIDRKKLRSIIFNDPKAKQWLEELLHPLIKKALFKEAKNILAESKFPYVIVEIQLLIEANLQDAVDRILVVDTPEHHQIDRVSKRNQITAAEIQSIINTQVDSKKRLQHATDVIHNDGTLEELKEKVSKLHSFYLRQYSNVK